MMLRRRSWGEKGRTFALFLALSRMLRTLWSVMRRRLIEPPRWMGRKKGLQGEVRSIIERRIRARRLDCSLIFHRTSKGRTGQPLKAFDKVWRKALAAATLPPTRIFHDLRRSAVRNLIRAGVDPSVAMKISGHRTRSMLDRYNIVGEAETAAALALADRYLSAQPKARNVEEGQFGDNRTAV